MIQQIAHGLTMAQLSPEDCRLLATACQEAGRHLLVPDRQREVEVAHIETLGAAFRAAAVAGMAQMCMRQEQLRELEGEMGDW